MAAGGLVRGAASEETVWSLLRIIPLPATFVLQYLSSFSQQFWWCYTAGLGFRGCTLRLDFLQPGMQPVITLTVLHTARLSSWARAPLSFRSHSRFSCVVLICEANSYLVTLQGCLMAILIVADPPHLRLPNIF